MTTLPEQQLSNLDVLLRPMHDFEAQFDSDPTSSSAKSYQSRLLADTSARFKATSKTSLFFNDKFKGAKLAQAPMDISDIMKDFEGLTKALPKISASLLPTVPEPSIVIPRTEQDVVNMFNEQIKPFIMFLARHDSSRQEIAKARLQWVPNPSQYSNLTVASLEWRLELVAEASSKPRKDSEVPSSQLSVRVDEIFVLSATPKDGRITRRHTKLIEAEKKAFMLPDGRVTTDNGYLCPDQFWTPTEMEKQMKGDQELLKGLLPLEFKCYGALRKPYFDLISLKQIPLDNSTADHRLDQVIKDHEKAYGPLDDLTASTKRSNVRSLVAKLQQAITYAWHYGTDVALLNDYASSAVIRLPDVVWNSSQTPTEFSFNWYFMSRSQNALGEVSSDPRTTGSAALAVGYELRRVLDKMEQALNKENAKPKPKPKPNTDS